MNGRIRLAAARTSSTPIAVIFEEVTRTSINCSKTKWIGVASVTDSHAQGHYRVGGWGYVEKGYPRPGSRHFSDVYSNCAPRAGSHRGTRFSRSDRTELRDGSGQGLGPRSNPGRENRALRRQCILPPG